jgi:putative sterol carrier protein
MAEMTINEFVEMMPKAFIPEKAVGVDAVIQFKFTGAQAGEWYVTIKDGKCAVAQGNAPAAKLTVTADSGDLIKIFSGQMDGMQAFMQGKLRVAGDMSLAMKLLSMFKLK